MIVFGNSSRYFSIHLFMNSFDKSFIKFVTSSIEICSVNNSKISYRTVKLFTFSHFLRQFSKEFFLRFLQDIYRQYLRHFFFCKFLRPFFSKASQTVSLEIQEYALKLPKEFQKKTKAEPISKGKFLSQQQFPKIFFRTAWEISVGITQGASPKNFQNKKKNVGMLKKHKEVSKRIACEIS